MLCECPASFYLTGNSEPESCESCSSGEAPLLNQDSCVTCTNVDDATACTCSNNRYNSEFNPLASRSVRCVDCPTGYYSSPESNILYNCTECPAEGQTVDSSTGDCSCGDLSLQETFCVNSTTYTSTVLTNFNPSTGQDVRYSPTITNTGISTGRVSVSETMQYLLPQALFECLNYKYYKQCQLLANLCVLHMYREAAAPCAAIINLASSENNAQNDFYDSGWKQNLPWLYYANSGSQVILQTNRIKAKLTLEPDEADSTRYAYIPFKLAKYAFDGEFLGWEDLSTQIWLCPMTQAHAKRYRRVGLGLFDECQFDLWPLVNRTLNAPNINYFYEMFLEDYNGELIDVPVLIDNFVDAGDSYPNRDNDNMDEWRLVRRFFLYENVSAIEGEGEYVNPTQPPTYVRWLQEARLVYELDPNYDETMYVPYLHLFYYSIESSLVEDNYPYRTVTVTQWRMDGSNFRQTALGFLITTHVLVVIWAAWKTYKWFVLHPQNFEAANFLVYLIIRVFVEIIQAWSHFIFWFLFIITLVWFVFFKFEAAFYIALPDNYDWENNYRTFEIIFGCMLSLKILVVWYRVFEQCTTDIFFLDRERKVFDDPTSPNAWRMIFVANEYNEMQNMTYVSIEFTLFWLLFFIEAEGWEYWATHDPDFSEQLDESKYNNPLKFCLFVVLLLVIGFIQYLMKRLFSFLVPLPFHNFVDLCSITNISVFIFDQRIHGYYIHGESPMGQTDISTNQLNENLNFEERGESRNRGLLSEYPNLQTFEIFLPVKVRQIYEVVYKHAVWSAISGNRRLAEGYENQSRFLNFDPLPKNINMRALINSRDEMSQYFLDYIAQVKNYPSTAIRERGMCQRFSDLPPQSMKNIETPLFFRDYWSSFKKVFFCDLDFEILILIACLYTVLDIWLLNPLQSTVIIYSFYKIFIEYPRVVFGARNLSTKALVDSRFLI